MCHFLGFTSKHQNIKLIEHYSFQPKGVQNVNIFSLRSIMRQATFHIKYTLI